MKKFFAEFKEFVTKGNVLDMAVGVIIGGAFGAITKALVENVITPLLAWLFNSPNPDALNIVLRPEIKEGEEIIQAGITLGLGTFIGAIVNFLVIALVLFLVIKAFNKARALAEKKKEEEEAAAPEEPPKPTTEELLGEILEELRKN